MDGRTEGLDVGMEKNAVRVGVFFRARRSNMKKCCKNFFSGLCETIS